MKRYLIHLCFIFSILFLFVAFGVTEATAATSTDDMSNFCQVPPFLASPVPPNVLLDVDVSGSMANPAYNVNGYNDADADGYDDDYDPNTVYEGYFDPAKFYIINASNIWVESTDPLGSCTSSLVCTKKKGNGTCVKEEWLTTCTGSTTGNYLNFLKMTRIDLLRWVMTGGTPATCTGAQAFNNDECEPELWDQAGMDTKIGSVCNDNLDLNDDGITNNNPFYHEDTDTWTNDGPDGGCILLTHNGEKLMSPWRRVHQGLVFGFKNLSPVPRMGAMFYSDTGVRAQKVYVGDFTAPNSTDVNYPFMNLITHVNSSVPGGNTPTGPAMRDALNYYAQNPPQYGGFTAQNPTSGDYWRNPVYVCDGGGTNCVAYSCAKNFVILMSDGDWNVGEDPVIPAYEMHEGFQNVNTGDYLSVSSVYTLSLFLNTATGLNAMNNVAMYGSFDKVATWPGGTSGYPSPDSLSVAVPDPPYPDWDENGNTDQNGSPLPDTAYQAQSALEIRAALLQTVYDILRQTTSGTAASVLATGEGSGANLLQAVFYPERRFGKDIIDWTGVVQNLWYYVDPFFLNSSIREDTTADNILNLKDDYITNFYYDRADQKTKATRCSDDNGDGSCDTMKSTVIFENLSHIWEAGELLWSRNLASDPRTIYTTTDGSTLTNFSVANAGALDPYMAPEDINSDGVTSDDAAYIINYVQGTDYSSLDRDNDGADDFRSRTVSIGGTQNVWKLGDIINSTPKIVSWVPLNRYNVEYGDQTYGPDYDPSFSEAADTNHFITTAEYKGRGIVFAGGNDGMLHAFKLGTLKMNWSGKGTYDKAKIEGTNLGKELWAFIPKNVLPYLKYLPKRDYCHVYSVDLSPFVFDASVNGAPTATKTASSWRTILLGGMRTGGASRDSTSTCTDCVKTPESGMGYSSYFALDVTDTLADPTKPPVVLWEFSDDELGFATTGPSVMRVGNKDENGDWFVVLGSGPTGPLSKNQFMGESDQNLKFFVLDLKTGSLLNTIDTGIPYAFAGSMMNSPNDVDLDYQDDLLYVGYVKRSGKGTASEPYAWQDGGVGRLLTLEDPDPTKWVWSTFLDGIGPVTSGISRLMDTTRGLLWLYFGTGRFYYDQVNMKDDPINQRQIFGIKEPCFSSSGLDTSCASTTPVTMASLTDVTDVANAPSKVYADSSIFHGWYIDLDPDGNYTYDEGIPPAAVSHSYTAERTITDPMASSTGCAFFTTFKPYNETCTVGGKSFIWVVDYNTGGSPQCVGKLTMQVSTGSIEQKNISDIIDRKTDAIEGIPPTAQGLSYQSSPPPVQRILQRRVQQ